MNDTVAPPKLPTGSDAHAVWAQWVTRQLLRLRFMSSPTVKANVGPRGISFEAAAGAGAPLKLKQVLVGVENDNVILCSEIPPTGQQVTNANSICVAKPYIMRRTTYDKQSSPWKSEYLYQSPNTRTENPAGSATGDIIMPPYTKGNVIVIVSMTFATPVLANDGMTTATYLDLNDDARRFVSELQLCNAYIQMESPFYTVPLIA